MAGIYFFSIGISSRNCAVYECSNRPNRENIRSFHRVWNCSVHKSKSKEIEWKTQEKVACKPASAVDGKPESHSNDVMCKQHIEQSITQRSDDGWGRSLFKKLAGRGGHHRVIRCASVMAICLHEAVSRLACRRACLLISSICSTIGRCQFIKKMPKITYCTFKNSFNYHRKKKGFEVGQNTLTKSLLSNQQSYTFHHTTSTDEVSIDLASEQDPMFNCPMNNFFCSIASVQFCWLCIYWLRRI